MTSLAFALDTSDLAWEGVSWGAMAPGPHLGDHLVHLPGFDHLPECGELHLRRHELHDQADAASAASSVSHSTRVRPAPGSPSARRRQTAARRPLEDWQQYSSGQSWIAAAWCSGGYSFVADASEHQRPPLGVLYGQIPRSPYGSEWRGPQHQWKYEESTERRYGFLCPRPGGRPDCLSAKPMRLRQPFGRRFARGSTCPILRGCWRRGFPRCARQC